MNPTNFEGANSVLKSPEGWPEDEHGECLDLPVFTDGTRCVSVWVPTDEERKVLAEGGVVAVTVFSGASQPPIAVGVGTVG